jgi:transposase-like protein
MSKQCKKCEGEKIIKSGKVRGHQRYQCKKCGHHFILQDARSKSKNAAKKALCVLFYGLGKASFRMLGKIFGHPPSIIYRWIRKEMDALPDLAIPGDIKEMEFDEMWHFVGQKNKKWILKALDRGTRRTLAWVVGNRDAATFRKLCGDYSAPRYDISGDLTDV